MEGKSIFLVFKDQEAGYQWMEKVIEASKTRWITSQGTQVVKLTLSVWGGDSKLKVWIAKDNDFRQVKRMRRIRDIKKSNLYRLDNGSLDKILSIIESQSKEEDDTRAYVEK